MVGAWSRNTFITQKFEMAPSNWNQVTINNLQKSEHIVMTIWKYSHCFVWHIIRKQVITIKISITSIIINSKKKTIQIFECGFQFIQHHWRNHCILPELLGLVSHLDIIKISHSISGIYCPYTYVCVGNPWFNISLRKFVFMKSL